RNYAYAYQDGAVPTFTSDVDGEYDIQLQANLAFPDRAYPEKRDSVSGLKMTATPDGASTASTCAAVPAQSLVAALALLLVAARRRR
ncbi:MAG: thrombospondin, partial [Myxococcaceae bacterium]|nr:thrombospondin [Myxococcaceae bacterium]